MNKSEELKNSFTRSKSNLNYHHQLKTSIDSIAVNKEKQKLEKIKNELNEKNVEVSSIKDDIKRLFNKSNKKETELKNYISILNAKMNVNVPEIESIDKKHQSIMNMITDIQIKVKSEINLTKKEMEKVVLEKFVEAEDRQEKLMNEKIEEQKKIFDKMNNTKSEIENIRKNFEQTNLECENVSKENEILKITLTSLQDDNKTLENKIKIIKKDYLHLSESVSGENKLIISDKNFDIKEIYADDQNSINRLNILNTPIITPYKSRNDDDILKQYNSEKLINSLKDDIKGAKAEYKILHKNFINDLQQRNEAKQLLQKCIEDIKNEISKGVKDVSHFIKHNSNISNIHIENQRKYEELLSAKQKHLRILENKLRILTFIYDNGFQNTQLRKNKLLKYMK